MLICDYCGARIKESRSGVTVRIKNIPLVSPRLSFLLCETCTQKLIKKISRDEVMRDRRFKRCYTMGREEA